MELILFIIVVLVGSWWVSSQNEEIASVRRRFNNVFAMLTKEHRAGMVRSYQQSRGCNEIEAMRSAIGDWESDANRWS